MSLHGWLPNGGSALSPPTATTTAARYQGPLLLVAGLIPHGRHLPNTCGRQFSSEHTPRLGFRSHQFPASWSQGPLRSETAQAPTHHTCSLRAQPACCTAHLHELPAQDSRSPVDLYIVLSFRAETYARRATDKHTGTNPSKDQRRGLRLLSEPMAWIHLC